MHLQISDFLFARELRPEADCSEFFVSGQFWLFRFHQERRFPSRASHASDAPDAIRRNKSFFVMTSPSILYFIFLFDSDVHLKVHYPLGPKFPVDFSYTLL